MSTTARNLLLFPVVVLPVCALTGALVSLVVPTHSTGALWRDVVTWAAVGWWVPILLLPAGIVVHLLSASLPRHWSRARLLVVLLAAGPLLFVLNFAIAAVTLTGDAPLVRSPHVLTLIVPALAYVALLVGGRDGASRGER